MKLTLKVIRNIILKLPLEKKLFYFLIFFLSMIYLGFFISLYFLSASVVFQPGLFLTEYAKHLAILSISIITFLGISVYWEIKKKDFFKTIKAEEIRSLFNHLLLYLDTLQSFLSERNVTSSNLKDFKNNIFSQYSVIENCLYKINNLFEELNNLTTSRDYIRIYEEFNANVSSKLSIFIKDAKESHDINSFLENPIISICDIQKNIKTTLETF